MKLYHGTTAEVAERALREGLRPRSMTGAISRWQHASPDDCVFLTTVYAPHFAVIASGVEHRISMGIVEVETELLDDDAMRPDLDAIAGMAPKLRGGPKARLSWIQRRVSHALGGWQELLTFTGSVAHRGSIPSKAITRVVVYEQALKERMTIVDLSVECGVGHIRRARFDARYRVLTKWFWQPLADTEIECLLHLFPANDDEDRAELRDRSRLRIIENGTPKVSGSGSYDPN